MSMALTRGTRLIAAVVGAVCVLVGAVLTLRPFTSLSVLIVLVAASMIVTGVADLVEARDVSSRLVGLGWIAAGVAVLVWPGATIRVITVFVGVAMIVSGALRLWAGIRGTREDRVTALLSGAASVIFGVLALSWPDVTVLVIAVVFGARTVINGLVLLFAAIRGRRELGQPQRRMGTLARAGRTTRALAALVVALGLLAVSVALHRGKPAIDAFYNAPKQVPDAPGQLLRDEAFDKGVPTKERGASSTRPPETTALSSGIVPVGKTAPPGPRPVIAWAHGTTGYARACAPSLQKDPFGSGALPALDQIMMQGWVLVATDYIGLGTSGPHPYLIGQGEARSVLDAVRAARQLPDLSLSDKTLVWGHSQGGNAALWTGQIAPTYAADVPLAGVVAMAPASDLVPFTTNLDTMIGGSLFESFIITAYSAIYPDVHFDSYVRPAARTIVARAAERCLSEPSTLVTVATSLALDKSIFATPVTQGALDQRLEQNTPTGSIRAPLLIAQGETDPVVLPTMQHDYTHRLCSAGQPLDYRTFPGLDHIDLVGKDSPFIDQLISWTQDRLDAKPASNNCSAV